MAEKRTVRIRFDMVFELPAEWRRPKHRKLLARLIAARETLKAAAEMDGDVHNLADATEAIELLASTFRRARASRHNTEGD